MTEPLLHAPLAIVGMACRLPGADGLEEYWQMLRAGTDATGELPSSLIDRELYFDPAKGVLGKSYSTRGGLVAERPFDRQVCPLPEELVRSADVCHLALCEVAAAACRHAGYDPMALPLRNTGVYVGHSGGSSLPCEMAYATMAEEVAQQLLQSGVLASLPGGRPEAVLRETVAAIRQEKPRRADDGGPALEANAAAGLVARAFGLTGPHMVIDAACASSLVAMALGGLALERGTIDMALVGGASFNKCASLILFSQAQSCSATGSRPFDADADGLISSEGYVVLVMKTLARALADGDTVQAVIRGIGISSDGRGRSLWAPRKEGQVEAVRRAYSADVPSATVQYIETHATSTQVGDATEIEALAEFFLPSVPVGQKLPIGSVKSNIGHTLETAGLAGLVKTILAMHKRTIPPSINVRRLSRAIDWQRVPFEVARQPSPWPEPVAGLPRRAAVNAFGIGGLNVHVVVDEFVPVAAPRVIVSERPGRDPEKDAVAIIGRGVILPGAQTLDAFWELIASGRNATCDVPPDRWNADLAYEPGARRPWRSPARRGGFVRDYAYDWKRHKVPPKQIAHANPLQFMLLDAADQALREAGYHAKDFDRRRTGVVVGTIFGGDFSDQLHFGLRLPEFRRTLDAVMTRHGVPAERRGELAEACSETLLRLMPAIHDETGSFTSSTLASRISKTLDLMGGAMALDSGDASSFSALAAAVDLLLGGACNLVLCAGAQRSMDLPTYEGMAMRGLLTDGPPRAPFDAEARGLVPGEGVVMLLLKRLVDARRDGDRVLGVVRGVAAAADRAHVGRALALATHRAWAAASVSAADVGLLEAGCGVPELDTHDVQAITETYGALAKPRPVALGSLVAQIGHTQAAHGLASLVKVALELEHQQVPATAGFTCASADAARLGPSIQPSRVQAPLALNDEGASCAGVSVHSLSGLAYHAIVERPRPQRRSAPAEQPAPVHRPRRPRLAFLFPGQGSQYAGMAQRLAAEDPAAAAALAEADEALARLGCSSFVAMAAGKAPLLGSDVWTTQAAMLIADLVILAALRARGLQPDVVAGHSYGEFAALVASGAWTLEDALRATRARADSIERLPKGNESMLATSAPLDTIERLIGEHALSVFVTSHNSPEQTVVGGDRAAIAVMAGVLKSAGFAGQTLAVPRAYHTPLMAEAQPGLRSALAALPITPPRTPLLSSVTNRYVAEPQDIRANLVAQLVTPVRYVALVQRLAGEGVTLFVEVGPGQVLTRLNRQILGDSGAVCVATDDPQSAGVDALERVCEAWRTQAGPEISQPVSAKPSARRVEIKHFDATEPRRLQMRESGRGAPAPTRVAVRETVPVAQFDATASRRQGQRAAAAKSPEPLPAVVTASAPRLESKSIERFLIEFVVEQTGYPPEIVDMDADLEADLGIDSIKKAQLFGELREYFDLDAVGQQKLADFPTLRHVERLLTEHGRGKAAWLDQTAAGPEAPPAVAPLAESLMAAPGPDVGAFLVRFVVEQTGYPPEIVDLDADLEADLGIDSIKKAQMFGELREHFTIAAPGELKLADFPTLRHVVALLTTDGSSTMSTAVAVDEPPPEMPAAPPIVAAVAEPTPAETVPETSQAVLYLEGTPYEMGLAHGRAQAATIKKLLHRIADLPEPAVDVRHLSARWPREPQRYFDADDLDELRGLADGLGVHLGNVLAHNLSLSPDYAPGCTQFAVTARANATGELIHGVNEDSPLGLRLGDCLARVVQVRRPVGRIPHVTYSVAGQIAGLNGVNALGVAVSSTLLLDRPRPALEAAGRVHSGIVKMILERAGTLDEAVELVRSHDRIGAWSMCISHQPTDRLCYVEYDGPSLRVDMDRDRVLTTNHCLLHESTGPVPDHSRHRLTRLEAMLQGSGPVELSLADAQALLRSRFDVERGRETAHPTMNTIRRIDTQVSIVMQPGQMRAWATPGPVVPAAIDHYVATDVPAPTIVAVAPAPPPVVSDRLMQRFVLRMTDKPARTVAVGPYRLNGGVILWGDNPLVAALRSRFESQGVRVHALTPTEDPGQAVAELESCWRQGPAPHLFIVSPRDGQAIGPLDAAGWQARQHRGVLAPYFLLQRWLALVTDARLMEDATLVGVTSLGGDFGFSGDVASVESGAIAGLLKSAMIESWVNGYRAIPVKVIDAPVDEPVDDLVAAVWRELEVPSYDVEIGVRGGQRQVVRAEVRPLSAAHRRPIARDGVWVCTGGARGITAYVAQELGRRYGLRLHLIGTAPEPCVDPTWRNLSEEGLRQLKSSVMQGARAGGRRPIEAWQDTEKALEIDRTLRAMAAAGVRATYHQCDVSDRAALARVLEKIRAIDGPIEGVLHGAGIGKDARFDRKERDKVEKCIRAKTDGAAALMDLTQDDPLRYFVAFGSISGRFGANGHTDYSLANDMLAKQVDAYRRRRPDCAAVAFHWHAWGDVGMATKAETRLALELIDMQFMPAREGVAYLVDELEAGAPEGEVLITDDRYYRTFFPAETLVLDTPSDALAGSSGGRRPAPLLDRGRESATREGRLLELPLDPQSEPFLIEHRLDGKAILPVVIGMEMFCEAAARTSTTSTVVELCDVQAVNGLRFHTDEPVSVRLRTSPGERDTIACALTADFRTRDGRLVEADRPYLTGQVRLADAAPAAGLRLPTPATQGWRNVEYAGPESKFYLGPPLRTLRKILVEGHESWGRIVVPALVELAGPRRSTAGWIMPSAAVDACLYATGLLAWWQVEAGPTLPRSFGSIRLCRMPEPGEVCIVHSRFTGHVGEQAAFDFALYGADGQVILEVRDYRIVWLARG